MEYGISKSFDVPIVLFIFKRTEKAKLIIERLSKIRPTKLYLIGDGARNEAERDTVVKCRKVVESHITWNCEVIKNYVESNRGVYENIAGGAKWVFEREKWAIFLEDDNLPELSFFLFCRELLHMYEHDTRVLWICGTNYLKECKFPNNVSYIFTQNMMPCGWASWGIKFTKFYDGNLELWDNSIVNRLVRQLTYDKRLKAQDIRNWDRELSRRKRGLKFDSWDYQMSFSLRANNLFGIVPKYNQICNVGVDLDSIHGGISYENIMTKRFCGLPTKEIEFPLRHPSALLLDNEYESKIAHIITVPVRYRIKGILSGYMKKLFNIAIDESFTDTIKARLKKCKKE